MTLASLSMAYGWGWRGDYGHELGAMLPGALVAMAICIASGRRDWRARFMGAGLFGALGWSFGGSMSYGIVLGYTRHIDFWNVLYGFSSIFIIGSLWGAAGGAFLGMALTEKRRVLNTYIVPMLLIAGMWAFIDYSGIATWCSRNFFFSVYDVDWVAALSALLVSGMYLVFRRNSTGAALFANLSAGWILGFIILTVFFGLRMTPPRSDNWAGMIGLVAALFLYLKRRGNRAGFFMGSYGALYGGLGFSCGALFLTLGAVSGIPIDWWKIMEKFFGLVMGFGIAAAAGRFIEHGLEAPEEGGNTSALNVFSYASLFLLILWTVLSRNLDDWFNKTEGISSIISYIFGVPTWTLIYVFGAGLSIIFLFILLRSGVKSFSFIPANDLGRGQLFFLLILWMAFIGDVLQKIFQLGVLNVFVVQYTFALLVLIITFLVILADGDTIMIAQTAPMSEKQLKAGNMHRIVWVCVPFIILVLAFAAVSLHNEPLPGSHLRFAGSADTGRGHTPENLHGSRLPILPERYPDGRPQATMRMDAEDSGIVLKYGDGPDSCDIYGARDVWVFESGGLYYMHYDGAGPEGWKCSLAISRDLVHWTKKGAILDLGEPGSEDSKSASYGVTYYDGAVWHMFYLGTPNTTPPPDRIPAFPYLTMKALGESPAGPWRKQRDVIPFRPMQGTYYSATASPGHIIKREDEYLQFFNASTDHPIERTISIARTTNLNGSWEIDPEPIVSPEEQIENSSLYFEESNRTWFLFTNHIGLEGFEYTDAVWVYWTQDLNRWDANNKAVVLDGANCTWSNKCIGLPSVVRKGNRLAILYDAPGGESKSHMRRSVGLAWLNLPLMPPKP